MYILLVMCTCEDDFNTRVQINFLEEETGLFLMFCIGWLLSSQRTNPTLEIESSFLACETVLDKKSMVQKG